MKNLKPISPFRRGAMQATRSSLQAAAEHVFIPPGRGIFTKWIMALLAIMLCVPALAQTTTLAEADCDLTVKTADGVPYVCIEMHKSRRRPVCAKHHTHSECRRDIPRVCRQYRQRQHRKHHLCRRHQGGVLFMFESQENCF